MRETNPQEKAELAALWQAYEAAAAALTAAELANREAEARYLRAVTATAHACDRPPLEKSAVDPTADFAWVK